MTIDMTIVSTLVFTFFVIRTIQVIAAGIMLAIAKYIVDHT